jgi:very-short-patch-repair endonuclease
MDRADATEIALLVARAETLAERLLLVALDGVTPRPRLRSQLEVDGRRVDIAVELARRRLAVILGRTGDQRTDADRALDDALARAGWPVYRLPPDRVTTRPQRAVGDVLAALREHGRAVPVRQSDRPVQPPWWGYDLEEPLGAELPTVGPLGAPANVDEEAVLP